MVASFYGPLILKNRRYLDPPGFIVEFDAEIPVNVYKPPLIAKLRLNNGKLRCSFVPSTIQVVAGVDVSALAVRALPTDGPTACATSPMSL
jgi:hypothetical protein